MYNVNLPALEHTMREQPVSSSSTCMAELELLSAAWPADSALQDDRSVSVLEGEGVKWLHMSA